MTPTVLRMEGLAKSFSSTTALAGLTCEVARGEVVGLLGPNGAGKTVRGWLQRTILAELPAWAKRWAVPLTAAAFAAVHPAVSFAPVLLLGLAAGVLSRARKRCTRESPRTRRTTPSRSPAALWGGA